MTSALYRLGGKAAKAAKALMHYQDRLQAGVPPVQYPINMADLMELGRIFHDSAADAAEREHADKLVMLGLDQPSVCVEHKKDCLPRAYEEYPSIMTSEFGDGIFYMYSPVRYDGTHFVPAESERISGEEEFAVGEKLGGGGWLNPIPVMPRTRRGVPLPADYVPMPVPEDDGPSYFHPMRVYVADKASMLAVEAYERDKAAWSKAMERLLEAAKALVMQEANAQVNAGRLHGDGLYINSSYRIANPPSIELTLCRDGHGRSGMTAGKDIDIPASAHYTATRVAHGRGYIITPPYRFAELHKVLTSEAAPDGLPVPEGARATPESVAFTALYHAVPHCPVLSEYGDLAAPDGTAPSHVKRGGFDLLIYSVPDEVAEFCPKGAKRISNAMHEWMLRDESDRSMGVEPPPMPDALSDKMMNMKTGTVAGALVAPKPALA